jgi:hypothetical protein
MRALLALAAFTASALVSSSVSAQTAPVNTVPLQAEIETVYTLPDGREVRAKGNFYRSRTGQVREDSPLGAVITDVAAGSITILIAETKEARVFMIPAEQRVRAARPNRAVPEVFEESVVGGHRVTKARAKGPQGDRIEFWTAKDLGVVTWTKIERAGRTTTKALRNLSTKEPSPDMFTIPADYGIIEQKARPGNGPRIVLPRPGAPNRR